MRFLISIKLILQETFFNILMILGLILSVIMNAAWFILLINTLTKNFNIDVIY